MLFRHFQDEAQRFKERNPEKARDIERAIHHSDIASIVAVGVILVGFLLQYFGFIDLGSAYSLIR